jgi:hypothetical protein
MLYGMPACKYNGKLKKAKKVTLQEFGNIPVGYIFGPECRVVR